MGLSSVSSHLRLGESLLSCAPAPWRLAWATVLSAAGGGAAAPHRCALRSVSLARTCTRKKHGKATCSPNRKEKAEPAKPRLKPVHVPRTSRHDRARTSAVGPCLHSGRTRSAAVELRAATGASDRAPIPPGLAHRGSHAAHLRKRWGSTIAPLHASHATPSSRTGWWCIDDTPSRSILNSSNPSLDWRTPPPSCLN